MPDGTYTLPGTAGNTGPIIDTWQVTNDESIIVQRQRIQSFIGGKTTTLSASGAISTKGGGLLTVLCTAASLSSSAGNSGWLFYDGLNAATGTIVGIIPPGAQFGDFWKFDMPISNAIFASAGPNPPTLTVGYQD